MTHQKPIINATIPGTKANDVARTLTQLSKPETAAKLKGMDVKYVFVRPTKYTSTEMVKDREELAKIAQNKGLKHIRTFPAQECPNETMCMQESGPIDVYEVTAVPTAPQQ